MADHLPENARKTMTKLASMVSPEARDLLQTLDVQLAGLVPAEGGGMMRVESMVASKTKNPVVMFIWGNNKGELSPAEAKGYAMQIIESAEAATQDAALWRGIIDMKGGDEQMAIGLIQVVRENRRKFEP